MNVVTIDFETYYDKTFSLSKLTTEEYIRDTRFEVIGVSTKTNKDKPVWVPNIANAVKIHFKKFDWNKTLLVAHNAMFDAGILSWIYDVKPRFIIDTMSMSRAIDGVSQKHSLKACTTRHKLGVKGDEVIKALGKRLQDFSPEELRQYANYCMNDVDITYNIFKHYMKKMSFAELCVIDITMRMFTDPILELDIPLLEQHLGNIKIQKDKLMQAAKTNSEILQSNIKFAESLQELGVTPPKKISPRTNKETFAFSKSDKEMTNLLEHSDLKVQTLVAARIGVKSTLEETRTERFLNIGKRAGVLPVPLKYYAAHTGRWGGTDKVNLQNLPSRSTNTIKKCILAPDNHVLIDADSSQIEARVLAWLAGQDDLVEAFANKEDVYKIMASEIYNKPQDQISKEERFVGKSVILGCGYGMGKDRFKDQLSAFDVDIDVNEADRIIKTYRQTYQHIAELWREAQKCLTAMFKNRRYSTTLEEYIKFKLGKPTDVGHVDKRGLKLPNGLYLFYPEISCDEDGQYTYKSRNTKTKIYGGKVIENVCQALARCIISEQMVEISKHYKVALTVHDSLVCVVKKDTAEIAQKFVEKIMRTSPKWAKGLPLDCESGIGKNYGECG